MNYLLKPVFTLVVITFLASTAAQAGSDEKMIIALKTDNDALLETDISELAIGEAKTIETSSGKVIDILRTAEGAELYVDGELLEMNFDNEGLHEEGSHGDHMIKKHVEIICDNDEECDKNVFVVTGDDTNIVSFVTDDGENIVIHKEIELSCTSEEEGTSCADKMVWISEGDDIDLQELHEMHMEGKGEGHKVIVIKKHVVTED